jgi:hypothetical protein
MIDSTSSVNDDILQTFGSQVAPLTLSSAYDLLVKQRLEASPTSHETFPPSPMHIPSIPLAPPSRMPLR